MKRLLNALIVTAAILCAYQGWVDSERLNAPINNAEAQTCTGWSNQLSPMDFESITVSNVAIGFTANKIVNSTTGLTADYAYYTVETADTRWRVDGTAPTAAIGHPATAGNAYYVCGRQAIAAYRAIRSGGSDSTFRVTYYRGN